MRRFELIGGTAWMGVGIFFGVIAVKLGLGALRTPGPGFLPLIMALLLVFLSLFVVARGVTKPEGTGKKFFCWRSAVVVVSVFVYGLLLDFAGFLISTFSLMIVLFGLLMRGKHRWSRVFLYAALTALAAWLVFSVALGVPFPLPRLRAVWM